MNWTGVMPAITTPFDDNLDIDHSFIEKHSSWMVDNGSTGMVALGSLGEGATLTYDEKIQILETLIKSVGDRVPVVAGISSLSTKEAVQLSKDAESIGCQGLMVLPPYVYSSDWFEMKAHLSAIIKATNLSCMLYNNPIAYGTDFLPPQVKEMADEFENLHAVKESSTDARRIAAIKALCGDRLKVFVGIDDVIVEGISVGATGWIAGLVNAMPKESVALYKYAMAGEKDKALELYKWFLPLLGMDTVPKFVQLIKLVQTEVGMGSTIVRPPRLELDVNELKQTKEIIKVALDNRPNL